VADQIEEIKSKTDIVSVIGEYLELKKAGRNYKTNCPFHSEKTPSFNVSPELQIFKCFGCGEAGDVFTFLQKYEGMDFYEALKFLADRAGVKLKKFKSAQTNQKQKLYEINSLANRFYNYVLLKHAAGKFALNYLIKNRELKLDTIKRFQLGYSPDRPFALKKFLVDKKKIATGDLEKAGIVYVRGGRAVDRFRGRVTFPLFDHRGNITGFAGRILPSERAKKLAKYINTPETEIYHKSRMLYGFDVTKREIRKSGEAIVVEGELDMISSWQAGIKNAVAIKGSALTQEQVKLLSRYAQKLIFAMDSDAAGGIAARRGIEIAEKEGLSVSVANLGKFKDPDEMAREKPDELKLAIKNAVGAWDFIIDFVFSRHKEKGGEKKAKVSREIVPVLASIRDKIVQAHYVKIVAEKLNVPLEAVFQQVASDKSIKDTSTPKVETVSKIKQKTRRELLEERLLTVAFAYSTLILRRRKIYSLVSTPLIKRILAEFRKFTKERKSFNPGKFASQLPDELVEGYSDMILKDTGDFEQFDKSKSEKEIEILIREIEIIDAKESLKEAAQEIREFEAKKQKRKLFISKEKFGKLTKKLMKLEGKE
jgi:DNA primase